MSCASKQRSLKCPDSASVLFFSILTVASQGALAFEFAQGVIVDPTASIVYLMNLDGGINAVALSDGTVLTTTPRAAKPLLLYDGTLLAQAEGKDSVLSLVGLRAKDLEPTFTVDVPLPAEIQSAGWCRLGASFYATARMEAGVILVQWQSMQRTISGLPTREPARVSTGFARIIPRDGRLIDAAEGEPSTPRNARKEGQSSITQMPAATPRCASSGGAAAIQYDGDRVTLLRWSKAGDPLPNVRLFGSDLTFRTFSRDCRHLSASKAENGWSWSIYALARLRTH